MGNPSLRGEAAVRITAGEGLRLTESPVVARAAAVAARMAAVARAAVARALKPRAVSP